MKIRGKGKKPLTWYIDSDKIHGFGFSHQTTNLGRRRPQHGPRGGATRDDVTLTGHAKGDAVEKKKHTCYKHIHMFFMLRNVHR
jgi:hypothetical protein